MGTRRGRLANSLVVAVTVVAATNVTANHTTPPRNLAAQVIGTTVVLTWTAGGSPPDFFVVEAGTGPGLSNIASIPIAWGSIRGINGTMTATQVPRGTYYVRVRAREGNVTGGPSNEVVVRIGDNCVLPPPPINFSATAGPSSISMRWTPPSASGIAQYLLEGGSTAGAANLGSLGLPASSTTFAIDVPPGRYFLRMRSISGCGAGAATPDVEVVVGMSLPFIDELNGATLGIPFGISYVATPTGLGAQFTSQRESRIQYRQVPSEGTMEWVLRVDNGYGYQAGQLTPRAPQALVFTTDCGGGDVSWPGSAWLWVEADGAIQFNLVTAKYQSPPAIQVRASRAGFSFGQWHTIGMSYGLRGVQLAINGRVVASHATAVRLGAGGTHERPIDVPTVGEAPCGFWPNNQYEWGFDGVVDRFRVSNVELDWHLSVP